MNAARSAEKGSFRPAWWIALGSGAGGGLRVALGSFVAVAGWGTAFPAAVLAINTMGSFLIGLLAVITGPEGRWPLHPVVRQGLTIGFCGCFTTFSLFSLQTLELMQDGRWLTASIYIGATVGLSVAAVWPGYRTGRWLNKPGGAS